MGLTARAAAQSKSVTAIEVGIDSQERLFRRPKRSELICVSLHGDYRYDLLKNTPAELQLQEKMLRDALIDLVKDTPLLVVGYSGRDASLMAALQEGYSRAGTGVLYWCGFGDGDIPENVRELLESARTNGRAAYYVQSGGFDDLMLRIALHCLEGDGLEEARHLMTAQTLLPTEERVDFALTEMATCGLIKSNAFPLTPPSEIYEFDLKRWPEEKVWKYFDAKTAGKPIVAAPFKKAYAFGTIDEIRNAFADRIGEKIERVPINDIDLRYEDGAISSLIRRALVCAMAERAGLNTDGREFLWEKTARNGRRRVNRSTSFTMPRSCTCAESPARVTWCSNRPSGLNTPPARRCRKTSNEISK